MKAFRNFGVLLVAALAVLLFSCSAMAAPQAQPACFAKPFGSGSYPTVHSDVSGDWAYWYCAWPTVIVIARAPGVALQFPSAASSATISDTLASTWALNVAVPCTDPTIKALCDAALMDAHLNLPAPPASSPPPAAYVVTSPPTYPLKPDGTRSFTPWPTPAKAGEPCDCTSKVISFGATYCKVPSLSTTQTIVAGCSLAKP